MSTIKSPIPQGLSFSTQYYFLSGDLYFKVERTLFRVHGHFFIRESSRFRERMVGADCARIPDGITEQTAIPVKDTSVQEFSQFLWVFYDPTYMYDAPASAWCTILSLSSPHRWDFPRIHTLSLHKLDKLSLPLVDRIVLYRSCSVSLDRLLPLYIKICTREESPTLEESMHLGWDLTVLICQFRECLLKGEGRGDATDTTVRDMAAATEGVPESWIQETIKSMLNGTREMSSLIGIQEHQCPPHHEVQEQPVRSPVTLQSGRLLTICRFDIPTFQAKTIKRVRRKNSPLLEEFNEPQASSSRPKAQVFQRVQVFVMKSVGKSKGAANA